MQNYNNDIQISWEIARQVESAGGRAYYVGGCVRDKLLGIENKDIDIEVHGIDVSCLENILDCVGKRLQFGKSFGIYSIKGHNVDVAMPRKEQCVGIKHTDFKVDIDPFLGTKKAAQRRDFTINALMEDVLTGEMTDHFGGLKDIKDGVIRHVNDLSFGEDPLRVLRGAQFAARFGFEIAPQTAQICCKTNIKNLSSERVFEELKKALLKAPKPSVFFEQLHKMNHLKEWFCEIQQLIGIKQNPKYHAEGDVFCHTMMVLDEAAKRRQFVKNPVGFMISAIAHDFGKINTTEIKDGVIHAYGHEIAGVPVAKEFLQKLTLEKELIKYVLNMVQNHMKPNITVNHNSSVKATNKMFDSSVAPGDLIQLALCDSIGKLPKENTNNAEKFLFKRLEIFNEYMSRPYVMGRDLIEAGITPGESFSNLLELAHKLRLAGVSKQDALKQVISQNQMQKS